MKLSEKDMALVIEMMTAENEWRKSMGQNPVANEEEMLSLIIKRYFDREMELRENISLPEED